MEENSKEFGSYHLQPGSVANYFLLKAREEDIDDITNLKLQKLIYYAYGFCLAAYQMKLFDEPIEAWSFGPVVPSLYREFKVYGYGSIDRLAVSDDKLEICRLQLEDKKIAKALRVAWSYCKFKKAFELVQMTHEKGSPWFKAYCCNDEDIINDKDIYEYFNVLIKEEAERMRRQTAHG